MNKEWLLCIGAGLHQTAVLQRASTMGFSTLAVDLNPEAPGRLYADEFLCHSAWDAEGINERLNKNIRPRIRGVVTQAARGCTLSAALLGAWLNVPHLNPSTAAFFLDKARALRTFNPQLPPVSVDSIEDDSLTFPCVVKQMNTSGGTGTHVFRSQEELRKFGEIRGDVWVEPFVVGRHLGIVGITDGHRTKYYGSIERHLTDSMSIDRAIFPASLDASIWRRLTDFATRILKTSGFNLGPFQLELILKQNGEVHFIELEPSILGSYISEWMIPAVGQEDMIADSIHLATGTSICFEVTSFQGIAYNKFVYAGDPLLQHKGIKQDIFKYSGEGNSSPKNKRMNVANILIHADSVALAEHIIEDIEHPLNPVNSLRNNEDRIRMPSQSPAG